MITVCTYFFVRIVDRDDLVVAVDEQNVLWLEVGVRELVVVQEQHGVDELVGDVPHLLQRVGLVVVVFLERSKGIVNTTLHMCG